MSSRKKQASTPPETNSDRDLRVKRARVDDHSIDPSVDQTPKSTHPLTTSLLELLDFSSADSQSAVSYQFSKIARSLLCDHVLAIYKPGAESPEEYELLEVELYLRKKNVHEDPYTHGSKEQSNSGRWYFHRIPCKSNDATKSLTSLTGYRGGTRKGLDLTIGGPCASPHFTHSTENTEKEMCGGILLRALRRLSDGRVICGPSNLVDEILRASDTKRIAELVDTKWAGDTSALSAPPASAAHALRVRARAPVARKPVVYSSPRIGLDLSHPGTTASPSDPRVIFVQKPYRFFTNPSLISNGRPQTFLGIYNFISEAGILSESGVRDEVARLAGMARNVVDRYAADFATGRDHGLLKQFIGAAGKGASSSPGTYLKMMGTLKRLDPQ